MPHVYVVNGANIFAQSESATVSGTQVSAAILDRWSDGELAIIGIVRAPVISEIDNDTQMPDGYAAITIKKVVYWQLQTRPKTPEELTAYLANVKLSKASELSGACAGEIVGGFSSKALGSAHSYPSKSTDQANLSQAVIQSMLPGIPVGWSTPFWCVDAAGVWSFREHSASQIQKVSVDAKAAIVASQSKLSSLLTSVESATTVQAVRAVTWS